MGCTVGLLWQVTFLVCHEMVPLGKGQVLKVHSLAASNCTSSSSLSRTICKGSRSTLLDREHVGVNKARTVYAGPWPNTHVPKCAWQRSIWMQSLSLIVPVSPSRKRRGRVRQRKSKPLQLCKLWTTAGTSVSHFLVHMQLQSQGVCNRVGQTLLKGYLQCRL